MSNNTGNTFLAVLSGAAIGAVLGILFAPDKGSNTREKIKDGFDDAKNDLKNKYEEASDELKKKFSVSKNSLENSFDLLVSNMNHKTEDLISVLEEKLSELKEQNRKHKNESVFDSSQNS